MEKDDRTPSGSYRQKWSAYDTAQANEKRLFPELLRDLCREVEEPEYTMGHPPFPRREMIFCIVAKVYSLSSSRRFTYDLHEMHNKGLISMVPSYNVVSEYMRNELLMPILQHLLIKSSLPLAEKDDVFAVDSTGLRAPRLRPWFNRHKGRTEKRRDHVKLHIMSGVRTNVITCAEVSEGTASDRNYFNSLVERTARYFKIAEVSADAGYVSGENSRTVMLVGGKPYIAFYKNCALDADYKSTLWKEALALWKSHNPEFMRRYYMRNNVEATFSSMKRKYGSSLKSKSTSGLFNEAICKAICYNISVLIQSMYELGINPTSWSEAKLTPLAEAGAISRALRDEENEIVLNRVAARSVEKLLTQKALSEVQQPRRAKRKRNDTNQGLLFDIAVND